MSIDFLIELEGIIQSRKSADPKSSYTAKLYADGILRIAQKVGEEGLETALAATQEDKQKIIEESADLIYHLLVLLAAKDIQFEQVTEELKTRLS